VQRKQPSALKPNHTANGKQQTIDFMFVSCIQNLTYRQISSFSFLCSKVSLDSSTWIVSLDTKHTILKAHKIMSKISNFNQLNLPHSQAIEFKTNKSFEKRNVLLKQLCWGIDKFAFERI